MQNPRKLKFNFEVFLERPYCDPLEGSRTKKSSLLVTWLWPKRQKPLSIAHCSFTYPKSIIMCALVPKRVKYYWIDPNVNLRLNELQPAEAPPLLMRPEFWHSPLRLKTFSAVFNVGAFSFYTEIIFWIYFSSKILPAIYLDRVPYFH